jgi:hypothetical protein
MRYTCNFVVTLSQLVEQFLEFERRVAPEAWHVADVPLWPYLRQRLFDDFSRERGFHAERQAPSVRRYAGQALAQRKQLSRIARRYDLRRLGRAPILLLSHPRHYPLGSQHVSPYTHFLLRELPHDAYWDLQLSDAGRHHVDDGLERVVYIDALYEGAFKGYALLHRWGTFRRSLKAAAGDLGAVLRRELGFTPNAARLERLVWNAVRVDRGWGDMCERLLDRVRPELVINVVHYNWSALALTARAHRRGLPVAELQHGTVSPEHIAYNVGCGKVSPTTPDYFLSFGEFWSDMVQGLGLTPARVPAIGFSWLENRMAGAPRAPSQTLLVLSQRSIGVELSRLAVDVAQRLAPRGWRVIYRLHPGEVADWRQRMPWLDGASLEVSTGQLDLYRQFGEVGAQLGVYSTALFEGVAFSLPTLIARLPGSASLEPFVRFGGAQFVSNAHDVVEALAGLAGAGVPAELVQRVWQPGAAQNFRRFVESWLGKTGS